MNEIIDITNYEEIKPQKPHKKTTAILKFITMLALMVGSGYVGAGIYAKRHHPQLSNDSTLKNSVLELISYTPSEEGTLSLPELYELTNPAVVAITTEMRGTNIFGSEFVRPSAGSGFVISEDGYIVTNDHVISGASNISVLLYDGREVPARIVGHDPMTDLAVIKIEETNLQFLSFAESDDLRVGTQVAAIGNPLGELANSMTVGYISALDRYINVQGTVGTKIQTDAAINNGNSGGPLIDLHGNVVGVVSAKSVGTGIEGLGFAIPATDAREIIKDLITHSYVRGRAVLGVEVVENTADGFVQILTVNPLSAAERAGLKPGDIIRSAGDAEIRSISDLRKILDQLHVNDEIRLIIKREDALLTKMVILDEYIPSGL